MLRNLQYVSGFDQDHRTNPAHLAASVITAGRRIATALQFAIEGWQEALAAWREYEQLRSCGVPHDTALRHALGAGPAPAQYRCRAAHPFCFAGRA